MRAGRIGILGLLGANGLSMAGTSMSMLAVPWFVLASTGSPLSTGLATFAEMLPYVLVQALGGPLVDRLGARRSSVGGDLLAMLGMGALPLLWLGGSLGLPQLCLLLLLVGGARGAGDVGRRVLLPELAERGGLALERASGLYDGVNRGAGLLGAPLAGLLMALSSAPLVLALDALSFGLSALLVGLACGGAGERREPPAAGLQSYVRELREGFGSLGRDRLLLAIAAMIVVTNFLDQAYGAVFFPTWTTEVLGSPLALGSLAGLFGAGAVAGNLLMAWLAPRLPRRISFAASFLLAGAPRFFVLALASSFPPAALVAFASGLGAGGINPLLGAVEYERVPPALRARVLGALGAAAWAGIPFGGLAGGLLAEGLGLRLGLGLAGLAYLLATLAPLVFPVWRQMERGETRREEKEAMAAAAD